jgi:glycosyltransferase involved in cell wall biosynthesis
MKPRLKILHIRDTHEIGGPGKTILETHRAIDSSRFSLHLAVFMARHQVAETPFVSAARDSGMPVHVIRGFNQYDPRLILRLVRLIGTLGIDVVHAHEVQSDVIAYLASKLHRVPTITTAHGWIGNRRKARLLIAVDKIVIRGFDRVIAVSDLIRRDLIASGVRPERVCLLHNAIVVERYARTGQRGFLADLLGRPLSGPVITSIGRLSREKGHADLVDALGIVAAQGYKFTAVLAGDGPERQSLVERVRILGLHETVLFPGYVSQPERILEETSLMVLPSHTEGLPNAALEAMAMEVPVLATRVGGTPEVVSDGETGRLVDPHSPESLARAIIEFLSNTADWRAMGRRGRDVVERQFSFRERTRTLERIYVGLVPGAGS